jgi:DNA-binding transcriptional LysR family regulator
VRLLPGRTTADKLGNRDLQAIGSAQPLTKTNMNVNLTQLKAFLTVARMNSFTKAAEILHLSQPALTVQVHQLEEHLGLKLLDRNTRHVRLTRPGRDLVPAFQNLLLEFERVVENASNIATKRHGVVRLACLPSFATTRLPTVIAQFREKHPHISFAVKDSTGGRIITMIRSDEVEFGITDGLSNWPDLETVDLYSDRIHAVFPKSHPIAKVKKITLDFISKFPLVLLDSESNSRTVLDAAFSASGRLATPACEVTYTSTAIGMVRAGLGITLLGSLVIEASNLRAHEELSFRPVADSAFVRRIGLIRKKQRTLSPSTQEFTELLIEHSKVNRWPIDQDSSSR